MIKPEIIHTHDAKHLRMFRDHTSSGWPMMIHDQFGSCRKIGLLERLVNRAVSILNFVLKPTGYQLVRRRDIMSRKMAAMTYCYGANTKVAIK